jgi:hypothetical protein
LIFFSFLSLLSFHYFPYLLLLLLILSQEWIELTLQIDPSILCALRYWQKWNYYVLSHEIIHVLIRVEMFFLITNDMALTPLTVHQTQDWNGQIYQKLMLFCYLAYYRALFHSERQVGIFPNLIICYGKFIVRCPATDIFETCYYIISISRIFVENFYITLILRTLQNYWTTKWYWLHKLL